MKMRREVQGMMSEHRTVHELSDAREGRVDD